MLSLWHVAASRRVNITSQKQYTIEAPSHLSPGHKNNRKKSLFREEEGGKKTASKFHLSLLPFQMWY